MASPFDVLRIDPDADEEAVRAAYQRRVKETHPDLGGSADELQLVVAAYEAITAADGTDARVHRPHAASGATSERGARVEYINYEVLSDYGWELGEDDLFEKAAAEGLDPSDHGRFLVHPDETLLEAAENRGFAWPFACRGGACANCAVAVCEGALSQPVNHILPPEMVDRGFQLSCNGMPRTAELKVIYNVKHLPGLDELRLPAYPFDLAYPDQ